MLPDVKRGSNLASLSPWSVLPTRQVIYRQLPADLRTVLLQHCQCWSLRNLRNCLRNAQLCLKRNANCTNGQKFSLKRIANSAIGQKFSLKRNTNCIRSKKKKNLKRNANFANSKTMKAQFKFRFCGICKSVCGMPSSDI